MTVPLINSFENIKLIFAVDQLYSKSQCDQKKEFCIFYRFKKKHHF